ncbi:MAG: single-stranded DNA-binding protein [Bacteroidales bacterium]|nr:single-stranded DNA-binding protein [Bacteroidales bacterium]
MEQINKIELRGLVGFARTQEVGKKKVAHFTVATSMAYNDRNGAAVIETQWHSVTAWEGKRIEGLDKLKKGDKVWLFGRLRYKKFTGSDGVERDSAEIIANRLTIIDDDDAFPCEM